MNIKKKFKKVLYKILRNITRPYAKKYLTGNLGKVVEDDEKITCYVKRSKVKKKYYTYTIACFGMKGEEREKVAKAYDLNKPICYVIDGLEFKKSRVCIFGYDNCEVIIRNCNFGLGVNIHVHGKCILDNTNINVFSYLSIGARQLVIKNMDREQFNVIIDKSIIEFGADDTIDVIDANIGNQKRDVSVSFNATNQVNFVNSKIYGNKIECKSKVINSDKNSSLGALDKVSIKVDEFNPINIESSKIVLNEEEVLNEKKSVTLKKVTEPIEVKRMEFVNLLRKIKTECESIKLGKVVEYQEELSVQPVSKVLKR